MIKNKTVVCKDGFSMSVQANKYSYCWPRVDNAKTYIKVEIGYPSHSEPLIIKYAEDQDNPTNTVYGYVPVELVTLVITKHGGMVSGEVPDGVLVYDKAGQKLTSTNQNTGIQ